MSRAGLRSFAETAITALGREPGGGLFVMPDIFMTAHRASIISVAVLNNVPAVSAVSVFVRDGGLFSYERVNLSIFAILA